MPEGRARILAATALPLAATMAVAGDLLIGAAGGFDEGTVKTTTLAIAPVAVALLLVWRRRPAMAALLQAVSVMFGGLLLCSGIIATANRNDGQVPVGVLSAATLAAWILTALTTASWIAVVLVFPSGGFAAARWRRGFLALAATLVLTCIGEYLTVPAGTRIPGPLTIVSPAAPLTNALAAGAMSAVFGLLLVGGLLAGLVNLASRFLVAAGPERQQLKWLVVVLGTSVVGQLLLIPLTGGQAPLGLVAALDALLTTVTVAAIGIALAGRRLWWIDAGIPKVGAVVALWTALSALFVLLAIGAGARSAPVDQLVGVPVALALLIAVTTLPARRRVEGLLTRHLYGATPGGFALLGNVRQMVSRTSTLEAWGTPLVEAVRVALSTPWAGLWIAKGAGATVALRPVAVVGDDDPHLAVLAAAAVDALAPVGAPVAVADLDPGSAGELGTLLPSLPATIAVMRGGDGTLLGLVACGRSPAAAELDVDALRLVASELGLALRTRQLEAELQDRVAEIEEQAIELRSSRQRLVVAQDEERRRIGRDLHDGAQQRLVSVAAKLRAIARSSTASSGAHLDELADEAEDAVFELQDLARGIYPSTLTDHGLAAALRQQAGRMPLRVHVEVEPWLAERRFGADVEMTLYHVALEALTNVQKHASDATCSITLRAADDARCIVLEVRDDGAGFDTCHATNGHGLINMADRLAAVGGDLSIQSRRGGGTWVTARVSLAGEVVPLRSRSPEGR